MIGICTDSSSQLPAELAQRFGVEIVPITVTLGEHEYLEGIDLTVDDYYALWTGGHAPQVSLGEPSPGQFALAYETLAERGCTQILSIHASSALSGTLNAALLAAHTASVPVRLVDSGTTAFGVSCCVWAAADAIVNDASFDEVASRAEGLAPNIGNVFIDATSDPEGIAVLSVRGGAVEVIGRAENMVDAVNTMARFAVGWGSHVKVGVGTGELDAAPIGEALAQAVGEPANVLEVVRFRFGPSAADAMALGTVACHVFRV